MIWYCILQGHTAAFCLGASSYHLQSDNKMSPTNLKANFCTFLSILYKTAGKSVFFKDLLADELFVLILAQITVKYFVFPVLFSKNFQKLGSIYSPTSFTVQHQGRLLDAPNAPSHTVLNIRMLNTGPNWRN